MKLLRLRIDDPQGFRSLKKGFEIVFAESCNDNVLDFNPYILAGRNGSGKSNILEALAEIFYHLDGIYLSYKPDYFEKSYNPIKSRVDAYQLEYLTYLKPTVFSSISNKILAHVHIEKKINQRPFVKIINYRDIDDSLNELSAKQIKSILPDYVVGYASGLNETLSIPFFKSRLLQYDRYFHDLESKEFTDPTPENSLVLIDEQLGQAIILTCLLMFDDPNTEELSPVLKPFREYINLERIDSFRLIIRKDQEVELKGTTEEDLEKVNLIQNLDLSDESNEAKFRTRSYIEKLKKCSTFRNEEIPDSYLEEGYFESGYVENRHYITYDFKVTNATKMAFQLHFENDPLKLFEFLQLSFVLNNYVINEKNKRRAYKSENPFIQYDIAQLPVEEDRIIRFKDLLVFKSDIEKSIYTKNLSDGEYQFIHTLGLCLLFKETNSLFLLDEPETHFNPDWKAKYISSIRDCFNHKNINLRGDEELELSDILITSHSPFLISDSKKDHVFVFNKGKVSHPEIKTFGTSVNLITMSVFGKTETISGLSEKYLEDLKAKLIDKSLTKKEVIDKADELGESIEKTLLFNYINRME